MKKIHLGFKKFIIKHYKQALFYTISILIICCAAAGYSKFSAILCICFGASIMAIFRLITYKTGKIPFFMIDKTWNKYRVEFSEDELEERYKEMSAHWSAAFLIITLGALIVWLICEALLFIDSICFTV